MDAEAEPRGGSSVSLSLPFVHVMNVLLVCRVKVQSLDAIKGVEEDRGEVSGKIAADNAAGNRLEPLSEILPQDSHPHQAE